MSSPPGSPPGFWEELEAPPHGTSHASPSKLTVLKSSCPLTCLSCGQAKGSLRARTVSCSPPVLPVLLDAEGVLGAAGDGKEGSKESRSEAAKERRQESVPTLAESSLSADDPR